MRSLRLTSMPGYVDLQTIPYRTHDLLTRAVLDNTKPGDRILEGGCSSGYFARGLVGAGRQVDGVEIDPAAAEDARSVCEQVIVGDLSTLDISLLGDGYNVMLFGDTLEHLPDPTSVLRRLRSKLSPTGVVVASVPNIANWAIRLSMLFGRFRYTERGILDRTHLRFFTKRILIEMFADAGFRIVDLKASVPVPGASWKWLCALAYHAGNLWPSLFGYQFVVTAAPRPMP